MMYKICASSDVHRNRRGSHGKEETFSGLISERYSKYARDDYRQMPLLVGGWM